MRVQTFDEYRVTLFKKKIREALPKTAHFRFERSIGRCHLIIKISRYFFKDAEEVGSYVVQTLKQAGIEASAVWDAYGIDKLMNRKPKLDYIKIQIDQAALPERKCP